MRPALVLASLLVLAPSIARADEPTMAPPYAPPPYAPSPAYAPTAPVSAVSPAELPPADPQPNTSAMRIAGIVATTAGGAQVLAGGALILHALAGTGLCGLYGETCVSGTQIGVGAALAISGGVAVAIGVPLIVRARKLDRAKMARTWHGAPGGAGWEWQF